MTIIVRGQTKTIHTLCTTRRYRYLNFLVKYKVYNNYSNVLHAAARKYLCVQSDCILKLPNIN